MDNFMDKLSGRFHAGDIMRANAEAEERERNRATRQAADYDHMMQELRRLHLKNVEVTEQVQQLIQSGIEQFEEYGHDTAKLEELNVQGQHLAQAFAIMKEELQQNFQQQSLVSGKAWEDRFAISEERLAKAVAESGGLVSADVSAAKKGVLEHTETVAYEIKAEVLGKLEHTETAADELKTEVLGKLEHTEAAADELRGAVLGKLEEMQAAIDRLADKSAPQGDEEKTELSSLKETIDEIRTRMEGFPEHVHRENVKVYRNVQAVILDVASQKTREVSDRLDQIAGKNKKDPAASVLAGLAMVFSFAALLLQILIHMGVL